MSQRARFVPPPDELAFYIVWGPASSGPPTYRHATRESAEKEAERLAIRFPGEKFYVLRAVFAAQVLRMPITQAEDDGDDIPF